MIARDNYWIFGVIIGLVIGLVAGILLAFAFPNPKNGVVDIGAGVVIGLIFGIILACIIGGIIKSRLASEGQPVPPRTLPDTDED